MRIKRETEKRVVVVVVETSGNQCNIMEITRNTDLTFSHAIFSYIYNKYYTTSNGETKQSVKQMFAV